MNKKHDITPDDLENLITVYLEKRGFSSDYIAGFIAAQNLSGWLRKNCPQWIRNSSAVHFCIPPSTNFPGQPNGPEKPKTKKTT